MHQKSVMNQKSIRMFVGGKQVAMCMRDDVDIPIKPRVNVQRKPLPVPVRVMWGSIITAKGRYDE